MIALVTDSTAVLPRDLVDRLGVTVIPVTVVVDGEELEEGPELDVDAFYARLAAGYDELSTSQPSPGRFIETYQRLIDEGVKGEPVDSILSVHVGSAYSGTVGAATLAAAEVSVPVTVVDSAMASFGIGVCVWEAAEAIDRGADLAQAAVVAGGVGNRIGSTFVIQAVDLVTKSGRITGLDLEGEGEGIAVLAMSGAELSVLAHAHDAQEAVRLMAEHTLAQGRGHRVAIGLADPATQEFADGLVAALAGREEIIDITHYRVSPSVATHTGPDTAGLFFWQPESPR